MFPELQIDGMRACKKMRTISGSLDPSKFEFAECRECAAIINDPKRISLYNEDPFCEDCGERPMIGNFWIPLHDAPIENGVLAILTESHLLYNYYLTSKPDSHLPASYESHSDDMVWKVTNFKAGDLVYFDTHLVSRLINVYWILFLSKGRCVYGQYYICERTIFM